MGILMEAQYLIIFDLGSNAIKYSIFDKFSLNIIHRDRVETIHKGLDCHHHISEEYLDEILTIVEAMFAQVHAFCDIQNKVYDVICVGTQIYRNANNAREVAQRFQFKFGCPLHIISQCVEAELEKLGVQTSPAVCDYADSNALLVDFGGGSTEFSWLFSERSSLSIPIGKNDFLYDVSWDTFKNKFDLYVKLDITPDVIFVAGSTACCYATYLKKIAHDLDHSLEGYSLTSATNDLLEICISEKDKWTVSLGMNLVHYLFGLQSPKIILTTYGLRHGLAYAWKNNLDVWMDNK